MVDIIKKAKEAFENLKNKRFFVSEADFQHTFAMELEKTFVGIPDVKVLLEFPISYEGRVIYVDIMLMHGSKMYPIELKYKTRLIPSDDIYEGTNININLILKNQGAQDLGGYELWRDIHRVETLVDEDVVVCGICIFITNDMYYVNGKFNKYAQAYAFRVGEEQHKHGLYKWKTKRTMPKYIKNKPVFNIKNDYLFKWENFYRLEEKNGVFKSLFIEVPRKTKRK